MAVAAVVFVVGGAIGQNVLVADRVIDSGEDVGQGALEEGTEAHAAGHGGEGLELVLGLKIIHLAHAAAHAATTPSHFVDQSAGANGEYGYVFRGFDPGKDLVEG